MLGLRTVGREAPPVRSSRENSFQGTLVTCSQCLAVSPLRGEPPLH